VSKHFTTLALGTLIHDGHVLQNGEKLSWNTKVKDVLPGWSLQDPIASDNCTLADLGGQFHQLLADVGADYSYAKWHARP